MGYTKKTQTNVTTNVSKNEEIIEKEEKTFKPEDGIPCKSMVSGPLYVKGYRSKIPYTWADYGDVIEVEYRDLIYMARMNGNTTLYQPRIIVEDEDFVEQNPKLKTLYDSMYTESDLYEVLDMSPAKMKQVIAKLPVGCKNAIKGIASTMIDDGRLDSISKIKALDEVFETNMLLTLVQD